MSRLAGAVLGGCALSSDWRVRLAHVAQQPLPPPAHASDAGGDDDEDDDEVRCDSFAWRSAEPTVSDVAGFRVSQGITTSGLFEVREVKLGHVYGE